MTVFLMFRRQPADQAMRITLNKTMIVGLGIGFASLAHLFFLAARTDALRVCYEARRD